MNLVLLTHPTFVGSRSQAHFARMLATAYRERGHRVDVLQPEAHVRALLERPPLAKWAGYADQYLLFPRVLRRRLATDPADTLYVFCDQALGPWIPSVSHRPHVVHCHDLLALRSALGGIPENRTSLTGRIYQRWIRSGFRKARHFVAISSKTRDDMLEHGGVVPDTLEVVHNGLNHPYRRIALDEARALLSRAGLEVPPAGILLHVGGGQWYKNTAGVLALYAAHAVRSRYRGLTPAQLWVVGPRPVGGPALSGSSIGEPGVVRFIPGVDTAMLQALYRVAQVLLFPSLAEGFGWPIAEALACGCPVLTTGEAPMTEVGGPHAHYLPRLAIDTDRASWAAVGAARLEAVLNQPQSERERAALAGIEWARRFDSQRAVDAYLRIYERILRTHAQGAPMRPVPR